MHTGSETDPRSAPRKTLWRAVAAALFSVALGASGPALAAPHGGVRGGGSHGGGFHAGGWHHGGGFHGRGFHHGFGYGFYPGFGLGVALGAASPWGWGYYPPAYGYYRYGEPQVAGQSWYYCPNPAGYYPYVAQCYAPWQVVPAS